MNDKHFKVTLLHNTPLWVCSHAVLTCWDSHDKGDHGGPKDQLLIDKVGNKNKHSSTLEHLIVCLQTTTPSIAQMFKENRFSIVTQEEEKLWTITSNVRALQDMEINSDILNAFLPESYKYLFY